MYNGVQCDNDPLLCCYNIEKWCPAYSSGGACDRYDRGAYPIGDMRVYKGQMTDAQALTPFPNSIMWNWATIIILGVGNMGALDFQARCMAAKSPNAARVGCLLAGCFSLLIGIPFAYLGAITR
jgi:hypothetical protein